MDNTNFTFMVYGFVAAWLILFVYVAMLVARQRRLKREIESLKRMLGEQRER
jgi:CcmD family protein